MEVRQKCCHRISSHCTRRMTLYPNAPRAPSVNHCRWLNIYNKIGGSRTSLSPGLPTNLDIFHCLNVAISTPSLWTALNISTCRITNPGRSVLELVQLTLRRSHPRSSFDLRLPDSSYDKSFSHWLTMARDGTPLKSTS
jgi:hypothetical protein